jgi:hypothetical protein
MPGPPRRGRHEPIVEYDGRRAQCVPSLRVDAQDQRALEAARCVLVPRTLNVPNPLVLLPAFSMTPTRSRLR